jgi:serine/threonine-protein kinase
MFMPVIHGETLAQHLEGLRAPMPLPEIASYLDLIASAIDYAHRQGFIHRDIKPSNILLDEQGGLYLSDFGLVHPYYTDQPDIDQAATSLTIPGRILGTPAYMAPERFTGEPPEPSVDIYALGVLIYQLVTGKLPFRAETPLLVAMKHVNEQPMPPRTLRPDLPEPAEAAIMRALAKRPAERFATASALASAFDAGIEGKWVPELRAAPPFATADMLDATVQVEGRRMPPPTPMPAPPPARQATRPPIADYDAATVAEMQAQQRQATRPTPVQPARTRQPATVPLSRGGWPRRDRVLLALALILAVILLPLLLLAAIQSLSSPTSPARPTPTQQATAPAATQAAPTPTPTSAPTPTPTSAPTPTPTPAPPTPTSAPATPTSAPPTPTSAPGLAPTPPPHSTPTPILPIP